MTQELPVLPRGRSSCTLSSEGPCSSGGSGWCHHPGKGTCCSSASRKSTVSQGCSTSMELTGCRAAWISLVQVWPPVSLGKWATRQDVLSPPASFHDKGRWHGNDRAWLVKKFCAREKKYSSSGNLYTWYLRDPEFNLGSNYLPSTIWSNPGMDYEYSRELTIHFFKEKDLWGLER